MKRTLIAYFLTISTVTFAQGSYAPTVGEVGTTAIFKDSTAIERWAEACVVTRGWQDIANQSLGKASYGVADDAIGNVDNAVVSLGDSGQAILQFNPPIGNIIGNDFAVFENSFSNDFLELAFVEVSSDGINFFRFDAYSESDTTIQIGTFGSTDATNIHNLAGKYRSQYGTPFDLQELDGITGLNINAITHIKLIDVIGSIDPQVASRDALGRIINDPYPTGFESAGFDLDAVAVLNAPPAVGLFSFDKSSLKFYPNPATEFIQFEADVPTKITIYNAIGVEVIQKVIIGTEKLTIADFPKGMYIIAVSNKKGSFTQQLIKL